MRQGTNAALVGEILGKDVKQVFNTYYHVGDDEKWEVLQALPKLDLSKL